MIRRMALPMPSTVRMPAVLGGQSNGRLPSSILNSTPGLAGGPTVRLVEVAMRSWKALTAAASAAGHTLKATSAGDSYRSYPLQQTVFTQRYTPPVLAGRPFKTWNGQRWYQKPGTAQAAVPGTSNHGWAVAVDTGEESDGDTGTESLDAATLTWLTQHAPTYGWYWELASEPWHIRYVSGDVIPPAVLAYERGGSPTGGYDDMETFAITDGSQAAGVWYDSLKVYEMAANGSEFARWQKESGKPTLEISRAEFDAGRVGVSQAAIRALLTAPPPTPGEPGGLVPHTHEVSGSTGPAQP